MTKGQTPLSEEFDVGDAIVHEVPLHVKLCLVFHLSSVPSFEFSLACLGHGFWGVHLSRWHATHVVGFRRGVQDMRKIRLLEIAAIQAKCSRKRSKRHGEELHGVDEADVPTLASEHQQFAPRKRGLNSCVCARSNVPPQSKRRGP